MYSGDRVEADPRHGTTPPAGWVLGGVVFAAMAMVLVWFFQVVEGIAALFQKNIDLVATVDLFPVDPTVWGVVHLVIGVLLIEAGFAVRTARPWARSVGIGCATVSAVANFLFVPYAPAWSLTVIALDVVVIWALCVYRGVSPQPDHALRSGNGRRR
jgi:hypothetical protein